MASDDNKGSLEQLASSEEHISTRGVDPAMIAALNKQMSGDSSIVEEVKGSKLTLGLAIGVAGLGAALVAVLVFYPDDAKKPGEGAASAIPAEMVEIKAGSYTVGCDDKASDCFPDESPVQMIDLKRFAIMRTEVTAATYAQCVGAGACKESGKDKGCSPEGTQGPVNCVGAVDAKALCEWKGWRLPTEAEWEAAARGPEALDNPWGAQAPECGRTWKKGCTGGRPPPVGTKEGDKSWAGVMDMGGSVSEWTSTKYAAYPGGETYGGARGQVHRGGAWTHSAGQFPTSHGRAASAPSTRRNDLGFRCAKSL